MTSTLTDQPLTVSVTGSQGDLYIVALDPITLEPIQCSCAGWRFRSRCRHTAPYRGALARHDALLARRDRIAEQREDGTRAEEHLDAPAPPVVIPALEPTPVAATPAPRPTPAPPVDRVSPEERARVYAAIDRLTAGRGRRGLREAAAAKAMQEERWARPLAVIAPSRTFEDVLLADD